MNSAIILLVLASVVYRAHGECVTKSCVCEPTECDMSLSNQRKVKLHVNDAFVIYGEKDLCGIARYVKRELEADTGLKGWVVIVGSYGIITSREEYALQYPRETGFYYRYTYKDKHDVEVFRTVTNGESPLTRNKNPLRGPATPWAVQDSDVVSNMTRNNRQTVRAIADEAFSTTKGDFKKAARYVYDGLNAEYPGAWVVTVGRHGQIAMPYYCAKYDVHDNTYLKGVYRKSSTSIPSHEIIVFAPSNGL